MISKSSIGAMLLVTGCCIGAGMVGLPVLSAQAGLIPTTLAMIAVYAFTTLTGLLIMEATLWFDHPVNLMSIVESAFGKVGKLAVMILFLFLFYCLFVAYFDGGGTLLASALSDFLLLQVPRGLGIFLFLFITASVTYGGTKLVDQVNRGLLVVLVIAYIMLVLVAIPQVSLVNLTHVNMKASLFTIPVLMICFGYQNLVPSLVTYLKRNVREIRFAIIAGNFIPFVIYLIWNIVILGMIPAQNIASIRSADLVTQMLVSGQHAYSVTFFVKMFSFFAVLTPILPITLSFVDFLRDGVAHARYRDATWPYFVMVFFPPLLFTLIYPNLFLEALGFAGGFIDVILFGVIPSLVILRARHHHNAHGRYHVFGGKWTPVLVLILCACILTIKHFAVNAG